MSAGTLLKHSVHNSCADAVLKIPKNQEKRTTLSILLILIVSPFLISFILALLKVI